MLNFVYQLILCIILCSCGNDQISPKLLSSLNGSVMQQLKLKTVAVTVDQALNNNAPVKMDLVIVYQLPVTLVLSKLNAQAYFIGKDQLLKDYAGMIEIISWEVTPGQVIDDKAIETKQPIEQAVGGFFFANYNSPGEHRARVTEDVTVHVQLGPTDINVIPTVAVDANGNPVPAGM